MTDSSDEMECELPDVNPDDLLEEKDVGVGGVAQMEVDDQPGRAQGSREHSLSARPHVKRPGGLKVKGQGAGQFNFKRIIRTLNLKKVPIHTRWSVPKSRGDK